MKMTGPVDTAGGATGKALGVAPNCRAESVPAQSTAVTIAASIVDLIVFVFMISPFKSN